MLSVLEDERSRADNQRGTVTFESINWDRFKNFDRKKKLSQIHESYLRKC